MKELQFKQRSRMAYRRRRRTRGRKRYKRTAARRSYKRRRSGRMMKGRSWKGLVPDAKVVTMRYIEVQSIPGGIAAGQGIISKYWSMADIANPSSMGGEALPIGYATNQLLYDHYLVKSAHVDIQILEQQNANGVIIAARFADTATNLLDGTEGAAAVLGDPQTTCRVHAGGATGSDYYKCHFKLNWSVKQFFKVKDPQDNQLRFGAGMLGHPVESTFLNFCVYPINPADLVGKISYVTTITYKVWCSERDVERQGII
nr:MAG: capsid protein [Cressdnaviricota sp.]